MKIIKIISLNFFIFFLFFLAIETLFGYWFDKDNLGPYMREHRMKKNSLSVIYDNKQYNHVYERNYYGFRGKEINLENVKIVLIGGSTADERYKPYEFTITGLINKKLSEDGINLEIVNAGIEGQSTSGHIYNFEKWFPKLKKFNPEYFIFYVGINDHVKDPNNLKKKNSDGHISNPSKIEYLRDNIKSRSLFYDLLRKVKHKYYLSDKKTLSYDFDHGIKNYSKKNGFSFLNYEDAIQIFDLTSLKNKNQLLINSYLNNIDKLVLLSKMYNAKPIFINQLTHEGNNNKKLFILNYSLIDHCKKKHYMCIDLAKSFNGEKEYWWDGIHTTPKGSKAIVEIIYPKLIEFLN